jgi:hypothetical protein
MVINALTEPLALVGSKGTGSSFQLFGYEVFSTQSNDVQNGIKSLSGLGSVFTPIIDAVKVFSENDIDSTKVDEFGVIAGQLLSVVTKTITSFVMEEGFDESNIEILGTFSKITSDFFGFFANNDLNPSVDAVGRLGENLGIVRDALADLDLEKMNKLNDILWNSTHFEEANLEMMRQLIESIKEMLGVVGSTPVTEGTNSSTTTTNEETTNTTQEGSETTTQDEAVQPLDLSGLQDVLENILDAISDGSLRGTIRINEG